MGQEPLLDPASPRSRTPNSPPPPSAERTWLFSQPTVELAIGPGEAKSLDVRPNERLELVGVEGVGCVQVRVGKWPREEGVAGAEPPSAAVTVWDSTLQRINVKLLATAPSRGAASAIFSGGGGHTYTFVSAPRLAGAAGAGAAADGSGGAQGDEEAAKPQGAEEKHEEAGRSQEKQGDAEEKDTAGALTLRVLIETRHTEQV